MGLLSLPFSQPRAHQGFLTPPPSPLQAPTNSVYEGLGNMRSAYGRKKMAASTSASASTPNITARFGASGRPATARSSTSVNTVHASPASSTSHIRSVTVSSSNASVTSSNSSSRRGGRPRSPPSMYQCDFVTPKAPKPLPKIEKKPMAAPKPKEPSKSSKAPPTIVENPPALSQVKPGPSRSKVPEHAELPRKGFGAIWGAKGKRKTREDLSVLLPAPSSSPSPIHFASPADSVPSLRPSSPGHPSAASQIIPHPVTSADASLPPTPSSMTPSSAPTFASSLLPKSSISSLPSHTTEFSSHSATFVSTEDSRAGSSDDVRKTDSHARQSTKVAQMLGEHPPSNYPPFKRTYEVTEFPDPPLEASGKKRGKDRSRNLHAIRRNSISVSSMTPRTAIASVATALRPSTASKASTGARDEYLHHRQQDARQPGRTHPLHQYQFPPNLDPQDSPRQSFDSTSSVSTGSTYSIDTASTGRDDDAEKTDPDVALCIDDCQTPVLAPMQFSPPSPISEHRVDALPRNFRPLPALPSPPSPSSPSPETPTSPSNESVMSPIVFGEPPSPMTGARDPSPITFACGPELPSTPEDDELLAYEEGFASFNETHETPRLTFAHPTKSAPRLARAHSYSHSPKAESPRMLSFAPLGAQSQLERDTLAGFPTLRPRRKKASATPARPGTPFVDSLVPYHGEEITLGSTVTSVSSGIVPLQLSAVDAERAGVSRSERRQGWSGEWNRDDMQDIIRKLRSLK
ncbi:hypothetical protein HGRIS_011040 [Hohenbuehelia grisea]|uniref:Uncharacterized protein n=1 Tax=Hohenbuehelia grisea TaxID=104357 RepID=A0ABR3IZ19_9AGAR